MTTIYDLQRLAEQPYLRVPGASMYMEFEEFQLPPGCQPVVCRLVFEQRDGQGKISIARDIAYTGNHMSFGDLVIAGEHSAAQAAIPGYLSGLRSAYGPMSRRPVTSINSPAPPIPPPYASPLSGITDASLVTLPKPKKRRFDKELFFSDISGKVIGQAQALKTLSKRLGIHVRKPNPSRPAVFLLAGSTGTGKTLTAKQVAKLLKEHTGIDYGFIRVDCNQLTEKHNTSSIVGAPPGYTGYEDKVLFEDLFRNKHQVILLDEVEKSHRAVLTVLMNAFSDGRLETFREIEGQRELDFRHCVFLCTSNLPLSVPGMEDMEATDITRACREQLTRPVNGRPAILPEIAARFTEILLYRNLSDADRVDILGLSIMGTAEEYNLKIRHIEPALLQDVVNDITLDNGARDAICVIEDIFGEPLADFADDNEGVKDITLSGTSEQVNVEPYAG